MMGCREVDYEYDAGREKEKTGAGLHTLSLSWALESDGSRAKTVNGVGRAWRPLRLGHFQCI